MSRNRRGTGLRSRADQGGFLEQAGGLLENLKSGLQAQPIQGSRARFGGDPGRTPAPEAPAPEAPAPSVADRAYMEEASRLTQQADPYMTAAMGVQPNLGAAFGNPMPQRDYAGETGGLMGALNQMEEENLKNMGYGPAPAMINLGQSTAGGAAAANMTQAAETAEAAGNLQPQVPLSPNYTGFPGRQPVTQGFADGLSLDMADGILAELEQSRNNPNRDFRGNSPSSECETMSRGTLSGRDRQAFLQTSRNLGLDPYEFGALIHQESGFDPNIVGGEGGNYYGLIQFGKPERTEAGLDPKRIGSYTIAEQMPHVEKWLRGRGFKTGMGIDRAYATILAGNPNANMDAQDSFGTSVNSSVPKFQQGGSLNNLARQTIGNLEGYQAGPSLNQTQFEGPQAGQATTAGGLTADNVTSLVGGPSMRGKDGNTYNIFVGSPQTQTKKSRANELANSIKAQMLGQILKEA